ncbi:hypothetical protein YC2023_012989 [Brassica napus]
MSSIGNLSHLTSLDISWNNFSGFIPSSIGSLSHLTYLDISSNQISGRCTWDITFTMIQWFRDRALDYSGNKFEGDIPRSIGLLKELHVLNVSQNQLSGEIPQALGSLSFLSYMNFSHNQLTGLVPGGTQFRRLNCTSFEDNKGLSGPSLDEICRDIHTPTPHELLESEEEEEEEEEEVLSWIAAVIGVIPGMAFGWVIGYILFSRKPEWFMNPFVRNKRRRSSTTTH